MILGGLPLEYTQSRLQARFGQRGVEPLWTQLQSARSLAAALDVLRASSLRHWVAIPADADTDAIERQLRVGLRDRVNEVARWMPGAWRPAARWASLLVDLPAVVSLARGEPPSPWMRGDPVLEAFAAVGAEARRDALRASRYAPVVRAVQADAAAGVAATDRARSAWLDAWRALWPAQSDDDEGSLGSLAELITDHLTRFAGVTIDATWALRRELEIALCHLFRRSAFTPTAAFAYLALVGLEAERVRAQLVGRVATGSAS